MQAGYAAAVQDYEMRLGAGNTQVGKWAHEQNWLLLPLGSVQAKLAYADFAPTFMNSAGFLRGRHVIFSMLLTIFISIGFITPSLTPKKSYLDNLGRRPSKFI